MKKYELENNELQVTINSFGAELASVRSKSTDREYIWQADPAYWKRHSPVLFPNVGSLKNKQFIWKDTVYPMGQHGFARDMDFELLEQKADEIWFRLASDEATKKLYPFDFNLDIGYKLSSETITVMWRVENTGNEAMYFSIGAHPAFNCPIIPGEKQTDYFFGFDSEKPLNSQGISADGLALEDDITVLETTDALLPIHEHLFDKDALVLADHQVQEVSILRPDKKPYITVKFDTPLVGLWSPVGKNAPFVCIEPWYGRCDASDFTGTLDERKYGQELETKQIFEKSYEISFFS